MRPVLLKVGDYKLFCMPAHGRVASRPHAFAMCTEGRVRVWLEPSVEVDTAWNKTTLGPEQMSEVASLVEENLEELMAAWEE